MFLHVGNNKNILLSDIVGIFDMDTATVAADTKNYLVNAEKNSKITLVAEELPKSFILRSDGSIVLSQISASSLRERIK